MSSTELCFLTFLQVKEVQPYPLLVLLGLGYLGEHIQTYSSLFSFFLVYFLHPAGPVPLDRTAAEINFHQYSAGLSGGGCSIQTSFSLAERREWEQSRSAQIPVPDSLHVNTSVYLETPHLALLIVTNWISNNCLFSERHVY